MKSLFDSKSILLESNNIWQNFIAHPNETYAHVI
jgi:hypothetical protein